MGAYFSHALGAGLGAYLVGAVVILVIRFFRRAID